MTNWTYIDQFQRQSLFSYKFPNKERGVWLKETNHERQMMLKKRAAICTNGWKRKWRLILLRKDRMYNFNFSCIHDQRGKKHDSWEIRKWREIKLTNKFEVYLDIFETKSKFEVKIVYFFFRGIMKWTFLMSWRKIQSSNHSS